MAYGSRSARAVSGLMGEVGQQSAGHLPLEHHAMANGGFSILPTGTTDPHLPFTSTGPPPAGNGVEKSFRESPSDSASAGALVLGGDANRQLSAMTFRGDSTRPWVPSSNR